MPATDSSQKSSGRAAQYTEVRYPSSMTVPTDAQPLSQNDEVEVRIEGNLWVAGIVIAVLEAVNRFFIIRYEVRYRARAGHDVKGTFDADRVRPAAQTADGRGSGVRRRGEQPSRSGD